ncbi:MAG TPA: hypothetical protein VGI39_41660 [Polyangiaceae bacterium]|jgi:hypothetical protein
MVGFAAACANGSSDSGDPGGLGGTDAAMADGDPLEAGADAVVGSSDAEGSDDAATGMRGDATVADTGTPEAAPPEASPPDDGGVTDAPSGVVDAADAADAAEAAVEAGCDAASPAVLPPGGKENFNPPNAHWAVAGSADINKTLPGFATLTTDTASQAGAIWWNAPYTFDAFEVYFNILIQAKASGADGMGFAWVPGTDVTKVGNAGGGYGVTGLSGYGVILDTFQNTGEQAAPFLTVVDPTGTQLVHAVIPNVRDGNAHAMHILFQGGALTVWIDNVSYLAQYALPSYTAFTGHWGFVAATGQSSESHAVNTIQMTLLNGQGCVP